MTIIHNLTAQEILDSRGRPTLKVRCVLEGGAAASVSVPSGASTGQAEAWELRDGDMRRYHGLGCRQAAANVAGPILEWARGRAWDSQAALDAGLCELDGTPGKKRLGANALLGVSLAHARAAALARGVPLYRHLAEEIKSGLRTLPRPTINLFSGGKHAGGQLAIQDILIVPISATSIGQVLEMAFAVYEGAVALSARKYNARPLKADEGGLAPPFPSTEAALSDALEAIEAAGLRPGADVGLAIDVAASQFHSGGVYRFDGKALTSEQMIACLDAWTRQYPLVSVEDGLAENDWAHWPELCRTLSPRSQVLGDDLLCTNPARIARAIGERCANALLLKVNQIGTVTEAAEARALARAAGWRVVVSARSGETEDSWLADLATAWGDQIKVGSVRQSERLSKYNRLLEIEAETSLPIAAFQSFV